MGLWELAKKQFRKGREQSEDMIPTTPSQMSESDHNRARQQVSNIRQDIDSDELLNSGGATKAPIEVIDEEEDIRYLLRGLDIDVDDDDMGSFSYTLVTEKRVIIVAAKIISTGFGTQHSISYQNISDVSYGRGMVTGVLEIRTPGHTYEITGVSQNTAEDIYNYIRKGVNSIPETSEKDSLDKLERLAKLRENGDISESEYQDKKSDLLDEV